MLTHSVAAVAVLVLLMSGRAAAQETILYYTTDAIGSVRMVTDSGGAVVARYDYRPFGDPCGTACGPQGSTERRQFAGTEKDLETDLNYFGARHYANALGRFTTVDPGHVNANLSDPQSWNSYAYVRNNPLRYSDPDGREYEVCGYAGSGGGGGCGTVSDQYFAILARSSKGGLTMWGGAIFAGSKVVGYYHQTRVDPRLDDLIGLTGALSSRWLRDQSTEMGIGIGIAATGGLAGGVLGGGLAATASLGLEAPAAMTEIANATARGARMANLSVRLSAREFQANLLKSGYKVIRQGVSKNGAFTILGDGEKTYTIYTATSTGAPSVSVQIAGQTISKIRLIGF